MGVVQPCLPPEKEQHKLQEQTGTDPSSGHQAPPIFWSYLDNTVTWVNLFRFPICFVLHKIENGYYTRSSWNNGIVQKLLKDVLHPEAFRICVNTTIVNQMHMPVCAGTNFQLYEVADTWRNCWVYTCCSLIQLKLHMLGCFFF